MSVILGAHRVPVLLYRFDVPRGREFLAGRAESDGIPRTAWSELASGVSVTEGGQVLDAERYLGPERRGLSLGVMTDTRPVESAPEFFRSVDLLIAEGTYGDSADADNAERNRHMTFAEAATVAKQADARRLVLTHFSPKMDNPVQWIANAQDIFPATTLAESMSAFTLSFDR